MILCLLYNRPSDSTHLNPTRLAVLRVVMWGSGGLPERGLAGAKRRAPPRESGEALLYKLQLAQAPGQAPRALAAHGCQTYDACCVTL